MEKQKQLKMAESNLTGEVVAESLYNITVRWKSGEVSYYSKPFFKDLINRGKLICV